MMKKLSIAVRRRYRDMMPNKQQEAADIAADILINASLVRMDSELYQAAKQVLRRRAEATRAHARQEKPDNADNGIIKLSCH